MRLSFWLLFILVILLEATSTQLPLTLIFLLCLTVVKREEWIFFLAFFAGIILDIFSLRVIGQTSMFFLFFIFLVLLYERKYEIATLPFVVLTSFFGSFFYLLFIQTGIRFSYAVTCALLGGIAFFLFELFKMRKSDEGYRKV